jgi:hypothetical protein
MAFTYTKHAAYIQDQLFGKVLLNEMKNDIRYLGEDILGDPAGHGDFIPILGMNGSGHGGRIAFDNNSSKYVGSVSSPSSNVSVVGLDLKIPTPSIQSADRVVLTNNFEHAFAPGDLARYMSTGAILETGIVMPRDGSVVGVGFTWSSYSESAVMDLAIEFRKNGTAIKTFSFTVSDITDDWDEEFYSRGAKPFVAGDRLDCYFVGTANPDYQLVGFAVFIEIAFS